ncbi:MAG TPA: SDR family oxidoreductase [Bacteroidales bacterium]|nr:SDR family oxidoreductase [Bacteroidales bacterium]
MNLKELIEVCKAIAKNHSNLSGDISFKDVSTLFIKEPGTLPGEVDEESIIHFSREKLRVLASNSYPENAIDREKKFSKDISACINQPSSSYNIPSEVQLHNILNYRYVAHLQSPIINGLLCSRNAKNILKAIFGENIFFVQYADPGYSLFRKIESDLVRYRQASGRDPELIFVESYGIIISSDSCDNIERLFDEITSKIMAGTQPLPEINPLPYNPMMDKALPVLRMLLSSGKPQVVRFRHNTLIQKYYNSQQEFHKVSLPLSPSVIRRCKTRFLYIDQTSASDRILDSFRYQLPNFINEYGYVPGIIVIKGIGVFAFAENCSSAEDSLDAFEDHIKITYYSGQQGGPKFLTPEQVSFLGEQNERCNPLNENEGRLKDNIVIFAGVPEGPVAQIVESVFMLGSNIVIAGNNETEGNKLISKLNKSKGFNLAVFVNTDLSDAASVKGMISAVVREFGGIDLLICNSGLPGRADTSDNDPESFSVINDVYYESFYLAAVYASEVMKIQNSGNSDHYCDIIHINNLECFRDENLNPAYSGASSACIGLTKSFALNLAPFRIKINSVCPGNLFEDSFWTDPQKGLFIRHLKTGKIQGARTTEDVRQFFENKVPLKRSCKSQDILKAILYIVDQEYETGQVLNVSGGLSVS